MEFLFAVMPVEYKTPSDLFTLIVSSNFLDESEGEKLQYASLEDLYKT